MKFYAYIGKNELGSEPLGAEGKMLFELKTIMGAARRVSKIWNHGNFRLYRYTNFYDNSTFHEIKVIF